jgi:hypothetical protein
MRHCCIAESAVEVALLTEERDHVPFLGMSEMSTGVKCRVVAT